MKNFSKFILKTVVSGLALGLLLHMVLFLADLFDYMSHAEAFHQIELGMPRQEVAKILEKEGVSCPLSDYPNLKGDTCRFSDFWRSYSVGTHSVTDLVIRKRFDFKEKKRILDYIAGAPD